jgi:hypothetical protein
MYKYLNFFGHFSTPTDGGFDGTARTRKIGADATIYQEFVFPIEKNHV